jgi:hypothetical protein
MDDVLAAVRAAVAGVRVDRLAVTHPADDDNVWFIRRPGGGEDLQIDSHPGGRPPFTIETDAGGPRTVATVEEAVALIEHWLLAAQ